MKYLNAIIVGVMILALAVPLSTAADDNASGNNVSKLTSQGDGTVMAAPDMATITLGVETRNESASVAARENAELMNETVSALLSAGIKREDIQTTQYTISTFAQDQTLETSVPANTTKPIFVVTNQVTVQTNNTTDIGPVLDAAIASGSNSIQGISFDIRDPKPQMDLALKDAVNDARRKAEVVASAAGVKLGKVLEISGGYSFVSSGSARSYALQAAAPTPVLPGQVEVTASISITYEITQ
jgi:uncharacterized protein